MIPHEKHIGMDVHWHTKVTVACLTTVAIMEAADEALPHMPNLAKMLPTWGWVHFLPLLLLIIAGVFWLIGNGRPRETEPPKSRIDEAIKNVKLTGAKGFLFSHFEARAIDLQRQLQNVWHHWNNAGERLVHPLDARLDKLANYSTDQAMKLLDERRDFMLLYCHHLNVLKSEFPEFTSPAIEAGYPADCEYQEVLLRLGQHIEGLKTESLKEWGRY